MDTSTINRNLLIRLLHNERRELIKAINARRRYIENPTYYTLRFYRLKRHCWAWRRKYINRYWVDPYIEANKIP